MEQTLEIDDFIIKDGNVKSLVRKTNKAIWLFSSFFPQFMRFYPGTSNILLFSSCSCEQCPPLIFKSIGIHQFFSRHQKSGLEQTKRPLHKTSAINSKPTISPLPSSPSWSWSPPPWSWSWSSPSPGGCWPEVLLWWPSARGRQRSPVIRSLLSTQTHCCFYFIFRISSPQTQCLYFVFHLVWTFYPDSTSASACILYVLLVECSTIFTRNLVMPFCILYLLWYVPLYVLMRILQHHLMGGKRKGHGLVFSSYSPQPPPRFNSTVMENLSRCLLPRHPPVGLTPQLGFFGTRQDEASNISVSLPSCVIIS